MDNVQLQKFCSLCKLIKIINLACIIDMSAESLESLVVYFETVRRGIRRVFGASFAKAQRPVFVASYIDIFSATGSTKGK